MAGSDDTMRIWVDSDFGFDDLWALLLLKHFNITIDGVSLVAGNTPLLQVIRNAEASVRAFEFEWPVYPGAEKPLQREPETAERILGSFGMRSRGLYLPYSDETAINNVCKANNVISDTDTSTAGHSLTTNISQRVVAIDALKNWLLDSLNNHIIALGPLTNLAMLLLQHPEAASKIKQITWLGGSRGRGNHSPYAEYNALADAEALAIVSNSDVPFRMIDLELCRQVCFDESLHPDMLGKNHQLLSDLLGGYLDIALQRERSTMAIYDPLAALSLVKNDIFQFAPASLTVQTAPDCEYGRTLIDTTGLRSKQKASTFEIAMSVDSERAINACMSALVHA